MKDAFLHKTAETHIRKRLDDPFEIRIDELNFWGPNGEKSRPYRKITIKAEREGRTFYAIGKLEENLEDAIESALEDLESMVWEFSMLGDRKVDIQSFLKFHLDARDNFEKKTQSERMDNDDILNIITAMGDFQDKREALERANRLNLKKELERA